MGSFVLVACQTDVDIDTSDEDTNNKDSVFTSKAKRASMFDGSLDDVLDGSACFEVQLPVDILFNGAPLTVNTLADLDLFTELDQVQIVFPITVSNYDYTQTTISGQQEFDVLANACNELINSDKGPITCVDFIYPLTIFTSNNVQTQNDYTIDNDQELYVFIENLDPTELYGFSYPLMLNSSQNGMLTIANDSSLESAFDTCVN